MTFNGWQKVKLSDVAEIIDSLHKTPNYSDTGFPMIRVTDIKGGFLSLENTLKVTAEVYREFSRKHKPRRGDIVFSRVGTYGVASYVNSDESFCLGQNTVFIIPKTHNRFMYYALTAPATKNQIDQLAVGSTQKTISLKSIKDIEIRLPDLSTQRRIADILSALDDKIELNRQTNVTLEAMAQAIFKEWFVDFNYPGATGELVDSELGLIPAGWRVGKLGELCRSKRQTVNPNDISPETPYVGLEHIPRKSLGLASWGIADDVGSQKTKFQKLDILFGKLRPYFHKVCIAPLDGICSTDILVIESFNRDMFSFCVNHLFSNEMIAYVSLIADGTRMPRVDWSSISNYEIVIPPESLLLQFNQIVFSFYEEIIENNYQSANLVQIRDTLLPKLMRGEIAV
jgi:type I restriction enzyme S subunit